MRGLSRQEVDEQRGAWAVDLVRHPGFLDFQRSIERELRAARGILIASRSASAEELGLTIARAQGVIESLRNIVNGVYELANEKVPERIKSLFE